MLDIDGQPCPAPGQVEHMTRHLEETEKAMQERVQKLEVARLSLEEVSAHHAGHSWVSASSPTPCPWAHSPVSSGGRKDLVGWHGLPWP